MLSDQPRGTATLRLRFLSERLRFWLFLNAIRLHRPEAIRAEADDVPLRVVDGNRALVVVLLLLANAAEVHRVRAQLLL